MRGVQNSACKVRNWFTLEQLAKAFHLEESIST